MAQRHEWPDVFEDDVVCLIDGGDDAPHGIVLETAWGSAQEDEEQGDDAQDEEAEEDNEAEGPRRGGGRQGDDDEEEDEDDEDHEDDKLPAGYVRVAWPNREEEEVEASRLRVVDRSFLHGDVVVRRTDKQGQIGMVTDVRVLVDARWEQVNGGATAVALRQLNSAVLSAPHPFVIGRYVTRGVMLGLVQDCMLDVDVAFGPTPFAPAGVVTLKKPAPSVYKPQLASEEELHEDEVGHGVFYPGMRLRAKHAAWKRGTWTVGGHAAATAAGEVGTVIAVRPVEVHVEWISGDQDVMQREGGEAILRPDECTLLGLWEESRWQVGDHVSLIPSELQHHADRIRAAADATAHNDECKEAASAAAAGAGASAASAAAAATPAAPASKPKKGKKAAAAELPPAPTDLSHLFAFAGTIVRTSTSVRVLWQDGTDTGPELVSSLSLVSRDHLLENDFMVHDFAIVSPSQRLVHVLAVNARERMVHIRYLRKALRQRELGAWPDQQQGAGDEQGAGPRGLAAAQAGPPPAPETQDETDMKEEGHTEWVAVFDLRTDPAFEYCLGGVVLRVPGAADAASSGALPMDSRMGFAGQVLSISEGLITVLWADQTQSTVEADQLMIVPDEEEDDGEEWEDEDDEDQEEEEEAAGAQAAAMPEIAAQGNDAADDAEQDDDEVDESHPASNEEFPSEWTNPSYWKKGSDDAHDDASAAVGSSSVSAATVDSATASVAALSVSSCASASAVPAASAAASIDPASARPGYTYSSFEMLESDEASQPIPHHFASTPFAPVHPKVFSKRVRDECKILSSSLPPGIHVRSVDSRMDLFHVCMFGTSGTPYFLTVFQFDLLLPADYPLSPPKAFFHSRSHRLSPNLYVDGTICLSLLNTWKGTHSTERWDPAHSNLLQLLVSLQGLVIGASDPYFLEAGYERQRGLAQASVNSHLYNETALLTALQHLTSYVSGTKNGSGGAEPFEDVVAEHVSSREVQDRARELARVAREWEDAKRAAMVEFGAGPSVSDASAPSTAAAAASVSLDEKALTAVMERFAIRNGADVLPAAAPAAETTSSEQTAAATEPAASAPSAASASSSSTSAAPAPTASAPVTVYHPSLAFITLLGRQTRALMAAMDQQKSQQGTQQ